MISHAADSRDHQEWTHITRCKLTELWHLHQSLPRGYPQEDEVTNLELQIISPNIGILLLTTLSRLKVPSYCKNSVISRLDNFPLVLPHSVRSQLNNVGSH